MSEAKPRLVLLGHLSLRLLYSLSSISIMAVDKPLLISVESHLAISHFSYSILHKVTSSTCQLILISEDGLSGYVISSHLAYNFQRPI